MRVRERERDPVGPSSEQGAAPSEGNLARVRHEAQVLLAAGDEAIRRSLSSDSRRFLRSATQQGGE